MSYVDTPVWYVRSLPALHPAGTAATREEQAWSERMSVEFME